MIILRLLSRLIERALQEIIIFAVLVGIALAVSFLLGCLFLWVAEAVS